jgi:hypothetical protein
LRENRLRRGYLWPAEKERKSFPFGFLGLFQERGAASPFLLPEGERQLNREREGEPGKRKPKGESWGVVA